MLPGRDPSKMFCEKLSTVVALCMLVITASARTEGECDRHATLEEASGHCRCNPGTSCVGPRCSKGFAAGCRLEVKNECSLEAVGCKKYSFPIPTPPCPDPCIAMLHMPRSARTSCLRNPRVVV